MFVYFVHRMQRQYEECSLYVCNMHTLTTDKTNIDILGKELCYFELMKIERNMCAHSVSKQTFKFF